MNDRLTYQGGLYVEGSDPISAGGNQSPVFASCFNAAALACTDPVGIATSEMFGFPIHVASVNYTVGENWYRDYGIYEQSTYTITDQLKATGGARFTYDTSTNTSQRITYQFPVEPPFTQGPNSFCTDLTSTPNDCYQTTSETSHAPTWMADLEYKPLDDLLAYGKYSRGYRAGGVYGNAPSNYRTFQPEKLDSFEAGIKTSYNGAVRATFNATAFYNNFRNQQLQASFDAAPGAAVSPTTGIINAGKSKIWGAEIEATLTPVTGLTISADYTYLRTEITAIAPIVSTDPNYIVGQNITVGCAAGTVAAEQGRGVDRLHAAAASVDRQDLRRRNGYPYRQAACQLHLYRRSRQHHRGRGQLQLAGGAQSARCECLVELHHGIQG